eukprot:SAG31_NODE_34963_length_327_cov_1.127193_1_plen_55_part_01
MPALILLLAVPLVKSAWAQPAAAKPTAAAFQTDAHAVAAAVRQLRGDATVGAALR